ncbi:MAG: hypothetical protein M3071_22500 [Actinomycetota bacterium]|nr:hypothetical protein [Actinomycetota bacterium]
MAQDDPEEVLAEARAIAERSSHEWLQWAIRTSEQYRRDSLAELAAVPPEAVVRFHPMPGWHSPSGAVSVINAFYDQQNARAREAAQRQVQINVANVKAELLRLGLIRAEPARLRDGKEFHRNEQRSWTESAEGTVRAEAVTATGRLDLLINAGGQVALVELKDTDWDRIRNVTRTARRHGRQVHRYLAGQPDAGVGVSPGVIYNRIPSDPAVRRLVEHILNSDFAIQVVWKPEVRR